MTNKLKKVVVFGHDSSSLITAAYLAHQLTASKIELTLVFDKQDLDTRAINISAWSKKLLNQLKLGEINFVKMCNANFSLGQQYIGQDHAGQNHKDGTHASFFSHSDQNILIGDTHIQQIYFKHRAQLQGINLDDFSMGAQIAKLKRFTPPSNDPKSLFNAIDYGYNVGHSDLCQCFLQLLSHSPVKIVYEKVTRLEFADDGSVSRALLSAGKSIEAELFINCSIPQDDSDETDMTKVGSPISVEYSHQQQVGEPDSCSHLSIQESSISKHCQVNKTLYTEVYRPVSENKKNSHVADKHAKLLLPFYRNEPWQQNLIHLGPALAATSYFMVDSLYPLLSSLSLLTKLWPSKNSMASMSLAFNDSIATLIKHIMDIDQLHLKQGAFSSQHSDEQLTSQKYSINQEYSISQEQQKFLELFKTTGKISEANNRLLSPSQWYALYAALDTHPERYHFMADKANSLEMCQHLDKLATMYKDAAQKPPLQSEFLKQQCNISI